MEHSTTRSGHGLKSYLAGFALALVLSAIPLALVAMNALPKPHTLIVIGVAAISRSWFTCAFSCT